MKRLIIFLALSFLYINAHSQTFAPNFLGNEFQFYKGVLLKLKDDAILGFDNSFYNNLKYCQTPLDNHVIYPTSKYKFLTDKTALANRIFVVQNIIGKDGEPYKGKGESILDKPIFVLKDTTTKEIIYYLYDINYDFIFPFNTSKIVFEDGYFCKKLAREIDDFADVVKINSPLITGSVVSSLFIYKNISKTETKYYLGLRTTGSTVVVDGKNVIVLFTDGTKWANPEKINVKAGKNGFDYSAFIPLTKDDLLVFSEKTIKKFRLYIFDKEVNLGDAEKFLAYVNCIKDAK